MGREKLDYRTNYEMIRAAFPDQDILSITQVCAYLHRDRRCLLQDKLFPARLIGGKYAISIAALARYISV